jgi:hypothetical protein
MSDFLNMSPEKLQGLKEQMGDDFQAHFPSVGDPLRDPASGVVAPKKDVKTSALERIRAHSTSLSRPKVRKGDFKVLEGKDVAGSYRLLAPSPLVGIDLICIEIGALGNKGSQSLLLAADLFEQMDELAPYAIEDDEGHKIIMWNAKLSIREFYLVYNWDDDAEIAIEINKPLNEAYQSFYNNRVSALTEMQQGYSTISKVTWDPYAETPAKDGGKDGYWLVRPYVGEKVRNAKLHEFAMTDETFTAAVINYLRTARRYLDDINHVVIQEVLGLA